MHFVNIVSLSEFQRVAKAIEKPVHVRDTVLNINSSDVIPKAKDEGAYEDHTVSASVTSRQYQDDTSGGAALYDTDVNKNIDSFHPEDFAYEQYDGMSYILYKLRSWVRLTCKCVGNGLEGVIFYLSVLKFHKLSIVWL